MVRNQQARIKTVVVLNDSNMLVALHSGIGYENKIRFENTGGNRKSYENCLLFFIS